MKPYLAIIADSLREALASRVLWVLVIGITLVLLALAPLGYRTEYTTTFLSNRDFFAPKKLAVKIRAGRGLELGPAHALWNAMDEGQRTAVQELAAQKDEDLFGKLGAMRRALNALIDGPTSFYNRKDWQDQRVLPEAEALLRKGREASDTAAEQQASSSPPPNEASDDPSGGSPDADLAGLSESEQKRLRRLLIEGAFPEYIRSRPDKTVTLTYAMLDFPRTWLSEDRLQTIVKDLVLPIFTNLLLGVVAVLIALLVTSTIIPEMFSPGTLHLLLSKPLSRSLVFLSRFFGGCFFVLINVTYLLAGLWLLLGVRFGIWNAGLLTCIPLFLFLFIVYFSVAALAGAYWKNAIVAVAIAAGLWGVCFILGIAKEAMAGGARAASLRRLVVGSSLLMGVSENDEVAIWSDEDGDWSTVFEDGNPLHGPLLIADDGMIVATTGGGRGPRFARRGGQVSINVGRASSGWSRESLGTAPDGVGAIMLDPQERLVVLTGDGAYRYGRDLGTRQGGLFGIQIPLPGMSALTWKKAARTEEGEFWKHPMDAHIHPQTGEMLVYTRSSVIKFAPGEGDKYVRGVACNLKETAGVNPESGVMIRWVGGDAAIALGDGQVVFLDGKTLAVKRQERPSRLSQPRALSLSPDGHRLAVLMRNGRVLLSEGGEPLEPLSSPAATAVALRDNAVWLGTQDRSVLKIDLPTGELTTVATPPLDNLQRINRWLVTPLTWVLPMPGELGETSRYLLSGKETTDSGLFQGTLDAPYESLDPWTPIVRCSIFVAVMLSLGCLYIERQEF